MELIEYDIGFTKLIRYKKGVRGYTYFQYHVGIRLTSENRSTYDLMGNIGIWWCYLEA